MVGATTKLLVKGHLRIVKALQIVLPISTKNYSGLLSLSIDITNCETWNSNQDVIELKDFRVFLGMSAISIMTKNIQDKKKSAAGALTKRL